MAGPGRKPTDKWKRLVRSASGGDDDGSLVTKRIRPALRRLGVSAEELNAVPRIGELLKAADGGMATVIKAMRHAPDATISAFLKRYDALSRTDRETLPVEAIALAAGVSVTGLLGSILLALQSRSVNLVKIIALTSHPKITMARARFGQLPSGDKDRAALDQAMGFLPSPKGPTFIQKTVFGTGRSVMDQQKQLGAPGPDDEEDDQDEVPLAADSIDLDKLFPPANEMQEKLVAIRAKLQPIPDDEPLPSRPPDTGTAAPPDRHRCAAGPGPHRRPVPQAAQAVAPVLMGFGVDVQVKLA